MRSTQLLLAFVASLTTFSSALSVLDAGSAALLKPAVMADHRMLFRRQDNSDNSNDGNSDSNTAGDSKPTDKPTDSPTPTSGDSKNTDSSSKDDDSKDDDSKDGKKTTDAETQTFAATVPPGGVSMITPAPSSGPQYYKIGAPITFAWNYTSLRALPNKIDVIVSCQSNQATYTIESNATADRNGGTVYWDTGKEAHGTAPLPMASYTLLIMDAESEATATPEPGHLSPYNNFQFGMYIGQDPTPLPDFECPTCESLASISSPHTSTLIVFTTALTVLSFSWFARGFGVL